MNKFVSLIKTASPSAVIAERTAEYLAGRYDDGEHYRDEAGNFDPNRLPENVKQEIRALSGLAAGLAGGAAGSANGGGSDAVDVLANTQIGGVVGQNAVVNNYYLTPVAATRSEEDARRLYAVLKDQIDTTCGNSARMNECRASIAHIVRFLNDKELSSKYRDLTNQSIRFLRSRPDVVEAFIAGERQRREAMDKSGFFRYILPGSQIAFGALGTIGSTGFGAATCAESAGWGCAAAGSGLILSTDEMVTGFRNFGRRASEQQPTRAVQSLMMTGMPRDKAETVALLASFGTTSAAGMLTKRPLSFITNVELPTAIRRPVHITQPTASNNTWNGAWNNQQLRLRFNNVKPGNADSHPPPVSRGQMSNVGQSTQQFGRSSKASLEASTAETARQRVTIVTDLDRRNIFFDNLRQSFNSRQRIGGNLDASQIKLRIGSNVINPDIARSRNGMPVYTNVSDQEIFSLYRQLTGHNPSFRSLPGGGRLSSHEIAITNGEWNGAKLVLRDISTTKSQTNARWTIEFQRIPSSVRGTRIELKFQ